VFGGSVSIMHIPTGIYLDFAAASKDLKGGGTATGAGRTDSADMWYLQGGIERKLLSYGATTVYGEYGSYSNVYDTRTVGNTTITGSEATRVGFGVNQRVDAAVMDLYAAATVWSFDDDQNTEYEDLTTVIVGSRIKF
jgi:hypothetical protein